MTKEELAEYINKKVDREIKRQCPWYDGTFESILIESKGGRAK